MPVVLGFAATSYLWQWMYNDQVGVFNGVLQGLNILQQPFEFFGDATTDLISITIMVVWKTAGFTMLLFVIGIQAIPEDLFEAARVDGASRWGTLTRITLPLLRRTFALALVISVIGSILAFDQFYILTSGGPNNETLTAVYWIYANAFTYFHLGYGAALSIVLLAILVAISVIQLYLLRDTTQY
jgi:multiple sugar transport system permease protein